MLTNNVSFNLPRQIKLHAIWLTRKPLSFSNSWVSNSKEKVLGSCILLAAMMLLHGIWAATGTRAETQGTAEAPEGPV